MKSRMRRHHSSMHSVQKRINVSRSLLVTSSVIVVALVLLVFSGVGSKASAAGPPQKGDEPKLSDSALQQLQALIAEKESRTPAQQKLDSQLIYALKFRRGDSLAMAVPSLQTGVVIDQEGKTEVDITANIGGSLIEDLTAAGADISYVYPQYNMLRANVPIDQLESFAGMPRVYFIMPKQEGQVWRTVQPALTGSATSTRRALPPNFGERAALVRAKLLDALPKFAQKPMLPNVGSVTSQGDTCHKANTARSTFGANGAGVRIGVLSDGVVSLAASQALGDLGPVTVLPGQVGTGDEGTAMLEIIHDLAPGAELFFATANPIVAAFAQNIRDLRTAGCDIIVDDVFYFVETPFQDGQAPSVVSNTNGGLVTQAVKDVTAAGCLYFSSAGNQGNQDDNTSSCYQGDFVDGGTLPGAIGGNVHDFDPTAGVAQSDLIQTGSGNPINLYWADPLGGAANDYDLYVFNNALTTVVASSTNVQNGTQDPFEQTGTGNNTNNRVVVLKKTGSADRFFHITINANGVGKLGTSTEGTTKGHSIAMDAYSVGATPALAPGPFPNPFSGTNVTETFSSDGPRRIFFLENGTAITPGNFSSTGGTLRQKPDITAADRVSVTGVGGFPTTFSGTSAAAPHAGAIAGLLRSAFPNLTPLQVRTILNSTAIDIEGAGVDRDSGVGIIMPFEAIQSNGGVASANFEKTTVTATEVCCNGNTFIEPGESGTLTVGLMNTGVAGATAITAVLSTTTPNVNILSGTSAYPNLAVSASGSNVVPYTFSLGSTAPCDLKINFTLTINYTGGNSPKVVKFSVQTGRPPTSVATTIDATAPPVSSDYTAVTGTQTNRVTRDGRASTCNLPKSVCPDITAATAPRFDAYTFSTCATGAATRCITVSLSTPCPTVGGGTQLFAASYLGSFVPTNVCTNYLADAGSSPAANGTVSFTFNIAAGSTFVVVVSEVPGAATNCTYSLTVSGVCLACPTAAKLDSFSANGYDDGQVLLQWKSSHEVDNLGYNVYRETNNQRTKINPQIIAGSALVTGSGVALTAGKSYAWADQLTQSNTRYWLEDVDLNGKSNWTGPVSFNANPGKAPNIEQSTLLTKIGLATAQMTVGQGSVLVERQAEMATPTTQTTQLQLDIAQGPAVKLAVKQEGWYRINQQELVAAGLDPKVDPRKLQLYVDGRPVPMLVNGEADGRFDPPDSLEFYGLGLDSPFTDTHVYWVVVGGQNGSRISVTNSGGQNTPGSFMAQVERKDRTIYFSGLLNGETENFFGPVVSGSSPADQSVTLTNVVTTPALASLDVYLQGVTSVNHQARVTLNGTVLGTMTFNDRERGKGSFTISQSQLREGVNTIQVVALGGSSDISLMDRVRVTYRHSTTADNNQLRMPAKGGQPITIGGFNSFSVRVMDITDADNPLEITGQISGSANNTSITVTPPVAGTRTLLAFTAARAITPVAKANVPSNWHEEGLQHSYVMITTDDIKPSLGPLKALRESQGLSVAVALVEDLYDEFSFGNKSPQAIKDFLQFARDNWRSPPRFVLFGGDSSYDPKNYLGYGDVDRVPTKLYDSAHMEAASDDWFVDFQGTGLPGFATGRLPARNAAEATALVGKILSYENSTGSNSVLFALDLNDGYNFAAVIPSLRALLPGTMKVQEISRVPGEDATTKAQVLAAINEGKTIVNYNGHGSVSQWRANILTNEDAAAMTNSQKLSFFVMMTCLNGYFDDPVLDSLAEALLKSRGGASAVFASAAQCEPAGQDVLNQELYRLLYSDPTITVGEAAARAKQVVGDLDVRRSWILFGDPAMRLK